MSLRRLFAQNLRQLSATKRSHAHVARALGINRQQFNNYITGKNLPNETVVDKICKYFKVEPAYMFREASENSFEENFSSISRKHLRILSNVIKFEVNNRARALSDGLYYVYFSNVDGDKSVVCSLLAVKKEAGVFAFRRVTRIRRKGDPNSPTLSGFHYGIISSRQNQIYLLGVDILEDFSISLLSGVSVISSNILYGGSALLSSGVNFRIVPFAIVAVRSGYTVKEALKGAKVYPLESPDLDTSVKQYIRQAEERQTSN
jgi:transcriptional regulator with XRE-family HTH domain